MAIVAYQVTGLTTRRLLNGVRKILWEFDSSHLPRLITNLETKVKRQRYQAKLALDGQHSTMTQGRKRILDDLGFVWDP